MVFPAEDEVYEDGIRNIVGALELYLRMDAGLDVMLGCSMSSYANHTVIGIDEIAPNASNIITIRADSIQACYERLYEFYKGACKMHRLLKKYGKVVDNGKD